MFRALAGFTFALLFAPLFELGRAQQLTAGPRLLSELPAELSAPTLDPSPAFTGTGATALSADQVRIERMRRFLAQRAASGSTLIPSAARQSALRAHAAMLSRQPSGSFGPVAHVQGAASLSAAWTPLGPSALLSARYGAVTGRVTAIAADRNDPTGNTVYLGTTGGGVWKSTSAAGPLSSVTFAPLTDTLPAFSANAGASSLPSLSIGAIAVQPAPNPVLLAGTGDPNDATDSLYGEGLLRSADNGLTWTVVSGSRDGANGNHSFNGLATSALAWSTATPTLAVAAFATSLEGTIVGAGSSYSIPGLYYSNDAGLTWRMAAVYDGAQVVQQPTAVITAGVPATSVVWDAQRGRFFAALRGHGYYSSADGATWTRLAQQPGAGLTTSNCPTLTYSPRCPIYRGVLAVQPATGDLYALTIDANNLDQGLWQDLCSAGSNGSCSNAAPLWSTRLDGGALDVGSGSTAILQGNYNLSLAALPQPGGGTLLFAGTVDLYRCSLAAGGSSCTFRNTTNSLNGCNAPAGVSPAQHVLATSSAGTAAPILFLGNDGGLWRSTDGVAQSGPPCSATDSNHFENLNSAIATGGSLAEIVGFAQDPGTPDTLLAGLGALGSGATSIASQLTPWPQLAAGEGGFPLLDPASPLNWTLSIGTGVNLKQCTLGSSCTAAGFTSPATVGTPQVSNDAALLDAPALLDPALTTSVLLGTCRVWRGPAGAGSAWSPANALSQAFGNGGTPCTPSSPLVRSLAAGGPSASSGNAGSTVLYAGMAGTLDGGKALGGHIFLTRTANTASSSTAWTDIALGRVSNDLANAGVFNAWGFDVSSLAVDSHDATGATIYATIMGFGGAPHLYQSTDFGAHWTNISSNLPSAPANVVVVDPNDANTLYVALDTGVYVTQAVNSCTSVNCWSVLGTGLPNAPVTALSAGVNLPTGDGRVGMLRAGTYGRGLWQTPLVTAASRLKPAITLSSNSFSFSTQQVGTQSQTQTLTITSSGSTPVTFATPAITGDFVETDTCTGQTIAVGSSCTVSLSFTPSAVGARSGQLTVFANIATGQATVSLSGMASAPASIVLTPLSLVFPSTTVSSTAAARIVTVSNTGGTSAALGMPVLTGDFALAANTCTSTLAPQTGCSLSITFAPTASGKRTGTLTLTDSSGTQTAQLTGTGNSPATDTLAPGSLTFPQQAIGTTSGVQQLTLTNAGDVPLTLIATALASGDFIVSNTCGNSLAAHSACAISVTFVPTTVGARTATLTVTDQFRVQTVALAGTGIAPAGVSLSPATLTFAATGVGLAAASQTLTLTNNGGLPLHVQQTTLSGGDFTLAATACGATLDPGAACTFVIGFTPAAAGPRSGTLTLTDDAGAGSQVVTLAGTGADFALTPNGATAVTVASGTSATFPLLLNSQAGLSGTVAFTCSGVPAHSTCTVSPSSAALGQSIQVTVTVQTGLTTAHTGAPPALPWSRPGTAAFAAFLAALPAWWPGGDRRKQRRHLRSRLPQLCGLLFLSTLILLATGCGATRVIPQTGTSTGGGTTTTTPTPTPGGTYTISVTGASYGLAHTVALSLTVQ